MPARKETTKNTDSRPRGAVAGAMISRRSLIAAGVAALGAWTAFRQGVLSNLWNPKMAVFFTSLLPQFAPPGRASFPALLALGLLLCAMTLVWLAAYAVVVARAGDVLRRLGVRRAIEAVTGVALVFLAYAWRSNVAELPCAREPGLPVSSARGSWYVTECLALNVRATGGSTAGRPE